MAVGGLSRFWLGLSLKLKVTMLMTSYSEGMYIKRLDLTNSVVGYFEFSVISHSKLFLLKLLFSHLISAISNYFSFPLRVRNSRIQLYSPNNLGLTRVFVWKTQDLNHLNGKPLCSTSLFIMLFTVFETLSRVCDRRRLFWQAFDSTNTAF